MKIDLKKITVIDCATQDPAYQCFNRLVEHFKLPFEYHLPSHHGIASLNRSSPSDAYIVFGSYANVCERLEWQKEIALFVEEKLKQNVPVLAICFGHQLMGDFFGGPVEFVSPDERKYEGTRQIKILKDAWGFKKGETLRVFTSHRFEIKKLPPDLEWLATSLECKYDLVCHKKYPYLGIQGHPESGWDFYESFDSQLHEKEIAEASHDGIDIVTRFLQKASQFRCQVSFGTH